MSQASRVLFRLPCHFPVRIRAKDSSEKAVQAVSTDLSTGGIGVLTDRKMAAGEIFTVAFRLPGQWREMRLEAVVQRQIEKYPASKRPWFTGLQFTAENPEAAMHSISGFIIKRSNFLTVRTLALTLCFPLAALCLARILSVTILHDLFATDAGRQWAMSGWSARGVKIYEGFHGALALGLVLSSAGFFVFKSWARKALGVLAFAGIAGQIARLYFKAGFLTEDAVLLAFYGVEILALVLFSLLFWLVARKNFRVHFDTYLKNLASHLER